MPVTPRRALDEARLRDLVMAPHAHAAVAAHTYETDALQAWRIEAFIVGHGADLVQWGRYVLRGVVDRRAWPEGPWLWNAPEEMEDAVIVPPITVRTMTSWPLCAVRHPEWGTWNGYVALPSGHPWASMDLTWAAEVHGGVTYSAPAEDRPPMYDDRPLPARAAEVWAGRHVIGFDTGHYHDLAPAGPTGLSLGRPRRTAYRTLAYVLDECVSLMLQAQDVAAHPALLEADCGP